MPSLEARTGALGVRLAKHLLRRTTYHITRSKIDQFAALEAADAVDLLMVTTAPSVPEPIDPATGQPWINSGVPSDSSSDRQRDYVKAWWMNEARLDEGIAHKMMFFLHSHFTVDFNVKDSEQDFDYLALLRYYALGNFKVLARKMVADNLMLKYLNGDQNGKWGVNENFAREFFELYTIGKGPQQGPGDYTNYTETDIQAAAQLLTGWKKGEDRTDPNNIDPDTGIPRGWARVEKHDELDKQFTAAFNNTTITGRNTAVGMWEELEEFVDMIFAQDETARHICRKLYRHFVNRNITSDIETDIIEPLAATFRENDYSLEIVMSELLASEHFYDDDNASMGSHTIGTMIKSPLENLLTTMNFFTVVVPDPVTETEQHYYEFWRRSVRKIILDYSGMPLFVPTVVAGYSAYYQAPDYHRNWFNSSTIITRYKLPQMLLENSRVLAYGELGVQLNIVDWVADPANISNPNDPFVIVSEMLTYLLPEYPEATRESYYMDLFLDGLDPTDWYFEWQNYLTTGDDSEVIIPLKHLATAIMHSQEYQLF
ncbi:MAG: DUF1800 family protein [Saprospiraceae bacterium]